MTARTVIGFPRWLATPTRLNFLLPGKRRAVAHRLQARHATLTEFLEVLGVDAAHVGQNVAGIEHHISRSHSRRSVLSQRHYGSIRSF